MARLQNYVNKKLSGLRRLKIAYILKKVILKIF